MLFYKSKQLPQLNKYNSNNKSISVCIKFKMEPAKCRPGDPMLGKCELMSTLVCFCFLLNVLCPYHSPKNTALIYGGLWSFFFSEKVIWHKSGESEMDNQTETIRKQP